VVNATPRPLYPGKNAVPIRRLDGPQGRSGRVRKTLPPPGFDPRTVQPVACPYTVCVMPAHKFMAVLGRNVYNYPRILILPLLLVILHVLSLLLSLLLLLHIILLPCRDKLLTHHHIYCVASAVCRYFVKMYHVPPVVIKIGNILDSDSFFAVMRYHTSYWICRRMQAFYVIKLQCSVRQ